MVKHGKLLKGLFLSVGILTVIGAYAIADDTITPVVSNHTSKSAVISWVSSTSEDACIYYNIIAKDIIGVDSVNDNTVGYTHFVRLPELLEEEFYGYWIRSGTDSIETRYTFRLVETGMGIPHIVHGTVYDNDETTEVEGAIVTLRVKNSTDDVSYPISTLTDENGFWYLNLGNLKDSIGSTNDVFGYSTNDTIFLSTAYRDDRHAIDTVLVSSSSPQVIADIIVDSIAIGPPTLQGPGSGYDIYIDRTETFSWSTATNADRYEIEFDSDTVYYTGSDTTYDFSSSDTGSHTWKVRSGNLGIWGPWTSTRSFDIIECDCEPGNCNGDANLNVLDEIYLINYKFHSGPAPTPYDTCSGDPNGDGAVNILDITFLTAKRQDTTGTAPAPIDCDEWLDSCSAPLRK